MDILLTAFAIIILCGLPIAYRSFLDGLKVENDVAFLHKYTAGAIRGIAAILIVFSHVF